MSSPVTALWGPQKIEVMYIFGGSGSHFGLLTKFGNRIFTRSSLFFFLFLPRGLSSMMPMIGKSTQAEAFTSGFQGETFKVSKKE